MPPRRDMLDVNKVKKWSRESGAEYAAEDRQLSYPTLFIGRPAT